MSVELVPCRGTFPFRIAREVIESGRVGQVRDLELSAALASVKPAAGVIPGAPGSVEYALAHAWSVLDLGRPLSALTVDLDPPGWHRAIRLVASDYFDAQGVTPASGAVCPVTITRETEIAETLCVHGARAPRGEAEANAVAFLVTGARRPGRLDVFGRIPPVLLALTFLRSPLARGVEPPLLFGPVTRFALPAWRNPERFGLT